ncbi:MAG: tetratricopeptide repeat protein [Leptolyngbyaceae cyanobacterium CRU_2_3]|nr:tetratricopeptide repeat protein [Leptolyngbyaceae cyanobacterium CRU_2_3]
MSPPCQSQVRSRLLHLLTWSSVLSVSLWSLGISDLGILYASAETTPITVRSGYTLLGQNLVNQAIAEFERAIRQFPQLLEARLGLAIAYRRAGRDADAWQAYERALAIDPMNRLSLLSLGTLGGYRPEWQDRGISALTALLQHTPDDLEARTQRALLYIYQGKFAAAIADYELILQKNPEPEAIAGAAQAYAYDGNYEQSLTLFDRYRQAGGTLQGDTATAYARVLRETGNPTAAIQVLEAPLRQQRRLTSSVIRMRAEQSMNCAAIGRFDLATLMLAPLRGRSDSRMVLGRALVTIGQTYDQPTFLNEGITLFKSVLTENAVPTVVKREIASVLAGFRPSQAIALDLYQQLEQQQPNDQGLQTRIAVLEHETGQLSEADLLTRLTQILKTLPSDPSNQAAIVQALIQLETPNPLLLTLYENLVRAGATEPPLYFRIAQMYVRRGNYATARSVLATYESTLTGKTDVAAELILAGIEQRQGDLDASTRRYQGILASNPTDKGILNGALQGLAGIYQSRGQFRDALVLYNRVMSLNPDDPTKPLGLASLQYQAGILSRAAAETVLKDWLTSQPLTHNPPELYSLVATLPANPRIELLYRSLVELDPNNMPVQTRLVEVMVKQNQAAAMAYIDQLIARDPENLDVYFLQGQIIQQVGNLRQAATAYESILKREPQNINALNALGGIRFRQRLYQTAIDLYSQVLELQPDNLIARSALTSLVNVGRVPRRIPALRRVEQMQQAESVILPDLNRLQPQQLETRFQPQGNVRLPWDRP